MPRKKLTEDEPKKELDVNNFKLEDLDDVGPIKAKRLRDAGVNHPFDIIIRGSQELAGIMNIKGHEAAAMVDKVYDQLATAKLVPNMKNAKDLMEYKSKLTYFKTGSTIFDDLLGGGFETQALSQIFGPEGAGKTQTVDTVVVLALHEGKSVMVLDCEGTFDLERVLGIAKARGFIELKDPKHPSEEDMKFLDKLEYRLTLDSDRIGREIDTMVPVILEKDIKLILIDGMVGKYRLEYSTGLGELGARQNDLKYPMKHLQNMAEYLNLCIILTNQVMAKPGFISEDNVPIGGHIFGHNFKYILRILKKTSPQNLRIIRFVKSNKHSMKDKEIYVNDEGISDFEKLEGNKIHQKQPEPEVKESGLVDTSLLE